MFILGKKIKMSQVWQNDKVVPVTVIYAEPNKVSNIRTKEKHGYEAIQIESGKKKREFKVKSSDPAIQASSLPTEALTKEGFKLHDMIDVSAFAEGDLVKITGFSKGRGFQGVVKRHGFHGGPKTHGQKNRHRAPGSIGSTAFQRVVPGRRMAGHMGTEKVSLKNVKIIQIDKEKNLLMVKGAVPGMNRSLVMISKIAKR